VPAGTILTLDISAPRPVITPFTLRFLIDAEGPRFDACSADTEKARAQILAAARAAGATATDCTIGMGVPPPAWAEASEAAIAAMAELGAGSVTLSDADVSLIAADSVSQADFDHVVGELETALPEVFSLTAVLTPKPQATADQGREGRDRRLEGNPGAVQRIPDLARCQRVPEDLVIGQCPEHGRFGRCRGDRPDITGDDAVPHASTSLSG